MTEPARNRRTVHRTEIGAPAGLVYGLLADAPQWPLYLPDAVHVERLPCDGPGERLRRWDVTGGVLRPRTLRHLPDAAPRRIAFREEDPADPDGAPSGSWTVEDLGAERALLVLEVDAPAPAGSRSPEAAAARDGAVAALREEAGHLARLAAHWERLDELVLCFEDSVRVDAPPQRVYALLESPGPRPYRVPAVPPDSVRVRLPGRGLVVHKQLRTPAPLAVHTGVWTVADDGAGATLLTSRHGVLLQAGPVTGLFGPDATSETVRRHVRRTLGRRSTAVMEQVRRYAEEEWQQQEEESRQEDGRWRVA
ncbi:SRPBCC family protein [Streptomyces sp. NPDC090056]|uniref:SRPBCC family protein n=1 Tax=Streptomyces sp. NPDC090056 TaxID=3365934 RepID=UPI0037FDDD45